MWYVVECYFSHSDGLEGREVGRVSTVAVQALHTFRDVCSKHSFKFRFTCQLIQFIKNSKVSWKCLEIQAKNSFIQFAVCLDWNWFSSVIGIDCDTIRQIVRYGGVGAAAFRQSMEILTEHSQTDKRKEKHIFLVVEFHKGLRELIKTSLHSLFGAFFLLI